LGRISGYLKQKQPKTCVWISAVWGKRNFAKVSGNKLATELAVHESSMNLLLPRLLPYLQY